MSGLILPDVVLHNLELERSLEHLRRVRERGDALTSLDRALRDLDPMLSLVKARDRVESGWMRPGYWYVRRCNAPFPDSYLVIEGPDGEFVEPHSGILEELRRLDTRRAGWFDDHRRAKDRERRDRDERRRRMAEDRRVEIAERVKAIDSPGVSMADTRWTYRAGARRAA